MKTQVELRAGNSTMVGFIESGHAQVGRQLLIGERVWTVSAVYATGSCAWWFKSSPVPAGWARPGTEEAER